MQWFVSCFDGAEQMCSRTLRSGKDAVKHNGMRDVISVVTACAQPFLFVLKSAGENDKWAIRRLRRGRADGGEAKFVCCTQRFDVSE